VNVHFDRCGCCLGPSEEQVADTTETRVDPEAIFEFVPRFGTELREPHVELATELLADTSTRER
jgi:hypothetical protein